MPFMSYQISDADAVANAGRFIKEADMDCVKLEAGVESPAGSGRLPTRILVIGHIGLTPQSSGQLGVFQGSGTGCQKCPGVDQGCPGGPGTGAYVLLVEAVPPEVTRFIATKLTIPVYSLWPSTTDGQLVICGDMLGLSQAFTPKFVKKYANVAEIEINAFKQYAEEVLAGIFPGDEHVYHIIEPEEEFAKLFAEFD